MASLLATPTHKWRGISSTSPSDSSLPHPLLLQARGRRRAPPPPAASSSIRDFIANETTLRSLDGKFRERPLQPTVEAPFLVASTLPPAETSGGGGAETSAATTAASPDPRLPPCPGSVSLHRLHERDIAAVMESGGQIILLVCEEEEEEEDDGGSAGDALPSSGEPAAAASAVPRIAQPRGKRSGGGSYCCVGRVAGLFNGTARVVVEQRVAVQGLDAGRGRAQAAVLGDRWAYMVRAAAVQSALPAAGLVAAAGVSSTAGAPSQPVGREVTTAVSQVADAAHEVAELLRECQQLAGALADAAAGGGQGDSSGDVEAAAREAESEAGLLLDWVFAGSTADSRQQSLSWEQIERLSFAPFAAAALMQLGGAGAGGGAGGSKAAAAAASPTEALQQQRLRAMEATDVGMRLEDGLEAVGKLERRLAAMVALQR